MNFVLYIGLCICFDGQEVHFLILFLLMCMCVYHICLGACGGQRNVLDTLHLELQVAVSCTKRVLVTDLGSPGKPQSLPPVTPFLQQGYTYHPSQIVLPTGVLTYKPTGVIFMIMAHTIHKCIWEQNTYTHEINKCKKYLNLQNP